MIVVCADRAADARDFFSALEGFDRVDQVQEDELSHALQGARACVFGWRGASLQEHLDELARVAARFPTVTLVLVTDREPRVARLTAPIELATVVWWRNIDTSLAHAVEEALLASSYGQMATAIQRSHTSPALRRALALAIHRAPSNPFRTSRELADAADSPVVTLAQAFRRRAPRGYTLGGFLSALLILRANQLRAVGLSWKAIEQELGFSRETLRKKAREWPGGTLKDLTVIRPRDLIGRFVEQRLEPLLRPQTEQQPK